MTPTPAAMIPEDFQWEWSKEFMYAEGMDMIRCRWIFMAMVATLFGAGMISCNRPVSPPSSSSPSSGMDALLSKPAPAWTLKDVNGASVRLSDFKGKVVILDFWATWCPPCRMEIAGFIDLQKRYGGQGLQIVGVSLDQQGRSVVKPFKANAGINYPVVMAEEQTARDY